MNTKLQTERTALIQYVSLLALILITYFILLTTIKGQTGRIIERVQSIEAICGLNATTGAPRE